MADLAAVRFPGRPRVDPEELSDKRAEESVLESAMNVLKSDSPVLLIELSEQILATGPGNSPVDGRPTGGIRRLSSVVGLPLAQKRESGHKSFLLLNFEIQ